VTIDAGSAATSDSAIGSIQAVPSGSAGGGAARSVLGAAIPDGSYRVQPVVRAQ